MVGGQKKKTADHRKLTQATVVTSAMIIDLREKRERIDSEKASRQARKDGKTATQTAAQAASIPLKKKNSTQLKKKDRVSGTLLVLPSIEEGGMAGSELED